MNSLKQFAARQSMVFAILLGGAALFYAYWGDGTRTSVIASLLGFLTTLVLVAITVEYVHTNQETLQLLRKQWRHQNRIEIKFGLKRRNDVARVWIANLGSPNVLVTKAVIRRPGQKDRILWKHLMVRNGQVRGFDLPSEIWENVSIFCDIDIELTYESTLVSYCETAMTPEEIKTYTEVVKNTVEIAAIIVGAIWTYLNYFRRRTYRRRLEPTVKTERIHAQGRDLLNIKVILKNVGLSKVPIDQDGTSVIVRAARIQRAPESPMGVGWSDDAVVFSIFKDHAWIEPGEPIWDELLVELPANAAPAYNIEVKVRSAKIWWTARTVSTAKTAQEDTHG
jgi:hypothetical protein